MSASVAALTTTFTPAASCTQLMFSAPIYKVWLNEPIPLPSSTNTGCYPSEFLQGYASASPSSSIAPMMSPLLCPSGWTAAFRTSTSYIACCPTSYNIHMPDTTVDTNRPAYGGTCFSDISSGQTFTVTQYTDSSIFQTQTISSTLQSGQAFAHLIDGIDQQAVMKATPTPSPTGIVLDTTEVAPQVLDTAGPTAGFVPISLEPTGTSTVSAAAATSSSSASLSSGDIAGIAVGITGAVAMIGAIILFCFLRRRGQADAAHAHANSTHGPVRYEPNPPPLPEKDYYAPSHSNSVRSSPMHWDEKHSCGQSISPCPPAMRALAPAHLQPRSQPRTPAMSMYRSRDGHMPTQTFMELPAQSRQEEQQLSEIYSPTREERMQMGHSAFVARSEVGAGDRLREGSELSYYEQNLRPKPLQPRSGASSFYGEI